MRHCCEIDCGDPAEFEVQVLHTERGTAGPDSYADQTDACRTHVGEMLTHQPDCVDPEHVYWEVRPLEMGIRP